ncbi:cuticle protein 67-like [Anabrus simplex]|uniref:cuticle protein 67-like n=1 Tax=Anabrus simplex TaxID=316456 RepID=UPI0035A39603
MYCIHFQIVILAAVLAVANAGYLGAPAAIGYAAPALATPAITAQQSNILRTPGNLGQISTYSKTINTPYSSVSKSDVRVSNDALAYGAVPAPAYGYAAPALAAPALGLGLAGHALAAPAIAAPVAHVSFAGLGVSYGW